MAIRFKLIPLDIVSLVLTILATIFELLGFFYPQWWRHMGSGESHMGMMTMRICEAYCMDKSVLDLEGGSEWIFATRVFEVFGVFFTLLALLFAILMISLRRRAFHTGLIYIHGAAAMFILIGVIIFATFHSALDDKLEGDGELLFPFGMCLLGGLFCIASSVVTGCALSKHLQEWDDEDDEDDY